MIDAKELATGIPTGAVTFLFTDIEGSTALWENYPTRMPEIIERHDRLLQSTVEAHGGYVFKMVGDACCAAFAYPREALRATLAAQRALFVERWGGAIGLRVRMALHTGAAEQERDEDYFGPAVNRVARLLSAGHGGQVLLSGATYEMVYEHPELVDEEARLVDLGEHRLKDLNHPVRIFQLAVPDLTTKFPPLRTRETPGADERYRIKDFLGSGGMAKVYVAHDEQLDQDVALKVLHPRHVEDAEFVARFEREAKSAAKLRSHPNIVPIYDRGEKKDGTYYMVMEYLSGGTLKDLVVREAPLAPRVAIALALQIADALWEAHRKGVIHRDIKPQNVLLTERGEAKVADFGIARAAAASTALTQTGATLGTPHYIAPEQVEGASASPRSDLYALGVTLYEMLTGELPYDAETPMGIMMKQLRGQLRPPKEANPEVPERINAITVRLLARNPEERYPEASALMDDLEQALRCLEDGDGRVVEQPASGSIGVGEDSAVATTKEDVEPSTVQVPSLTGKNTFQASSTLTDAFLTPGEQKEVSSDTVPEGDIIGQSPEAGTEVEPGSLVSVTVSSGPREKAPAPENVEPEQQDWWKRKAQPGITPDHQLQREQVEASPLGSQRQGVWNRRVALLAGAVALLLALLGVAAYTVLLGSEDPDTAQAPQEESQQEANAPEDAEDPTEVGQEDTGDDPPDPARVVEEFYQTAVDKNFSRHSRMMTPEWREAWFPSQRAFEKTYDTLQSIEWVVGPTTLENSGETATVTGETIARDTNVTQHNGGTWTLVYQNGEWRISGWNVYPISVEYL